MYPHGILYVIYMGFGVFFFLLFWQKPYLVCAQTFFFHSIDINEFSIFIYLFNTHRVLQFELVYLLYLLHLEISWCPLEDHYIDQRFLWILGEWFVEKGFLHLRTEKNWHEENINQIQLQCFFLGSKLKYRNILTINYSIWMNWI